MRLQFHAGPDVSELDLGSGLWTVGGGPADGVRIDGLPPALLRLAVSTTAVWLLGILSLRVGRAPLDRATWRLLLPGESVALGAGRRLRLPPEPPATPDALLRAFAEGRRPLPRCAAAVLVAVAGPDAGETYALSGASDDVGRLEQSGVRLSDVAASRRQLRLVRTDAGHRAEPCPGPNPVRRNGRRLSTPVVLRAGDVLGVGRTLLCYFPPLSAAGTARRAPPAAP